MQLQFETLEYQKQAIHAVVQLFQGQRKKEAVFSFTQGFLPIVQNDLELSAEEIQDNLHAIQKQYNLCPTNLQEHGLHFSIEMETGTGKTYVYLRTIFELNKQYGFKKFVIIVPSVAIREGVLQSIRATKEHFEHEFDKPVVNSYVYDSKKLNLLRGFAQNSSIEILIINIDAFNKDSNVINIINESGQAPIIQINQTRPIVIIDEPQNMQTDTAKKSIDNLNPLFILRYSATHKQNYNKIYSLNAVDAYNQKLVKQIEVHSTVTHNDNNGAYLIVKSVENKSKGKLQAKIEIHAQGKTETKKKTISISSGDDIFEKSGRNENYRHGFIINGMDLENQQIQLSSGIVIRAGENNDAVRDALMKTQIRLTIEEHLKKEALLNPLGIKVLSLFFIDKVANYRNNGKFFQWFEEIYRQKTGKSTNGVHDGYFSQDKDTKGNSKEDENTYNLIMRDKEKLLSFDSPLRFIFSHSALKEGWDNPNVFQICTLNETQSPIKKRQEIGRGLRICVNQNGQRVRDEGVNILTIIPNESYESFAANLQKEYEEEGITFQNGGAKNTKNKRKQIYRQDFLLDPNFQAIWEQIRHQTRYVVQFRRETLIQNAAHAVRNMPNINKPIIKTDSAMINMDLEQGIVGAGKNSQTVDLNHITWTIPDIIKEIQNKTQLTRQTIFDILQISERINEIANNPQRFIELASDKILFALHNLMVDGIQYEKLPEENYAQSLLNWQKLAEHGVEFFINEYTHTIQNPNKTIVENYMILDSQTEQRFAQNCESYENVALYFKLPHWFKIKTPIGNYNPDWAIVLSTHEKAYFIAETKNTGKSIAGGVDMDKLHIFEQQKIKCAKKHFAALQLTESYRVIEKLGDLSE